jgi:hypothetical protein
MSPTIRERLHKLIHNSYQFCRDKHERTHILVQLCSDAIKYDPDLKVFFERCLHYSDDPRYNIVFDDNEWHEWPTLIVQTENDTDEVTLLNVAKLEGDIPKIVALSTDYAYLFCLY